MSQQISASVGENGTNKREDVLTIQKMLNNVPQEQGGPSPKLTVDGKVGPKTIGAIQQFQLHHFGWSIADGRVDPNGPTFAKLSLWDTETEISPLPNIGGGFPGIEGPEIIPASVNWRVETAPSPPALDPWAILFNHRLKHYPDMYTYFEGKRSATAQELEDGWDGVSVDCYAVRIKRWPKNSAGAVMNVNEFTYYVRTHINDFANGTWPGTNSRLATFNMYDDAVDGPVWKSKATNGSETLISIKMADNGSVGVVMASPANWIFKTFTTKNDWDHPVAGNRIFGIIPTDPNATDEIWFGTRGVDRVHRAAVAYTTPSEILGMAQPYALLLGTVPWPIFIQRRLWRSFHDNLHTWINNHGGLAEKIDPFEHVYDWSDIKKYYIKVTV